MQFTPGSEQVVAVGDRGLVEDAVTLLLAAAPTGWKSLHGQFQPLSHPPVALAWVQTDAGRQAFPVPPAASATLAEHQRRAAAAGLPWRRMTIDYGADGRLSAHAHAPLPQKDAASRTSSKGQWRRRLQPVLVVIAIGSLTATAAVVMLARPWALPPRADMIQPPTLSARQLQANDVIVDWLEAHNRTDSAAMRALLCADPKSNVQEWIARIERNDSAGKFYVPEAIADFRDHGETVSVRFATRIRPLNDEVRAEVQEVQATGGFFSTKFVLADQEGALKICDYIPEP